MLQPLHHALLYASVQQAIAALPAGGTYILERYPTTSWVVGGFLRDTLVRLLHGRPVVPKDLDVLVAQKGDMDSVANELASLGYDTTLGSMGSCKVDGVDLWFAENWGHQLPTDLDTQRSVIEQRIRNFPMTCQRLAIHVATGTFVHDVHDTTEADVKALRLSLGDFGNISPGLFAKLPRLLTHGWTIAPAMAFRLQHHPEEWATLVAAYPSLGSAPKHTWYAAIQTALSAPAPDISLGSAHALTINPFF